MVLRCTAQAQAVQSPRTVTDQIVAHLCGAFGVQITDATVDEAGRCMAAKKQMALIEVFETSRPANPLFCHQEFLEKLAEHSSDAIGRRVTFLLQRLSIDARRLHYKPTHGVNRGWRRSRLGGNRGSHFYAWWAPSRALPLRNSGEFSGAPDGALFVRDLRHHDDHSPLKPQSFEDDYLPVTVLEQ